MLTRKEIRYINKAAELISEEGSRTEYTCVAIRLVYTMYNDVEVKYEIIANYTKFFMNCRTKCFWPGLKYGFEADTKEARLQRSLMLLLFTECKGIL